ncbi:restriction endonuclease subunit S [uncultured Anaerovibrio sp.]|uniref:restriction endonuclease subunit S n=1 Tax=uncultured Anaerovibrio sp. TaxID=361586 RepID=UPI0025CEC4EB|nr:restriction endonuclease subunit S [uncultured Anaerovibrio sp.]
MKAIMRDKAELKDSGIEWIGLYPVSWDMYPANGVFSEIRNKNTSLEYTNQFSFRYGEIVDKHVQGELDDKLKDTISAYNIVQPDTIMINGLNLNYDFISQRVAIVREPGIITSAYLALYPNKERINPRFAVYLFKAYDYQQVFHGMGSGIRKTLSFQNFKNIFIVAPQLGQQEAIANYLDDNCSKIDAIIAEAKASIEEYKDLKQAVITQAVTLGKKKNRPLKDTNILWIGKTPFEWQVAELKFFASIKSGITLGQKYPAGAKLVEMPYLRVANVQGEYVDLSDVKTIQVLPEEVDKYRLEAGVVLMTEGGDRDKLGRGCVWHGEITPCLHQNHIFALTTKSDKLLPEYFSHVTTSEVARCYFDYTAKKTTNLANTNSSTIMNFRLPIPPLEEQREIVQYLDKRIKTLNDMISEKQSLIEDLESYKKSLIYEVVTGKRKVVE